MAYFPDTDSEQTNRDDFRQQYRRFLDYWWEKRSSSGLCRSESQTNTSYHAQLMTEQTISLAVSLLEAADLLKHTAAELARVSRRRAECYIEGVLEAGHKPDEGRFVATLHPDTRELGETFVAWGSSYGTGPLAQFALMLCRAHHFVDHPKLLDIAEGAARVLAETQWPDHVPMPGMDVGVAIELMVEIYEQTGQSEWLDRASTLSGKAIDRFLDSDDPSQRFKMLVREGNSVAGGGGAPGNSMVSADGIHWGEPIKTGGVGDRTTMFYNPFRKKWVYSIRGGGQDIGRARKYREHSDFLKGASWTDDEAVFWCGADHLDPPDPGIGDRAQLYNLNAVGYESLMLGLFEIHLGPDNKTCAAEGHPKTTELKTAFSRDGFASMRADDSEGILLTRPVTFSDNQCFFNVDNPQGELRVELCGENGAVLPGHGKDDCLPITLISGLTAGIIRLTLLIETILFRPGSWIKYHHIFQRIRSSEVSPNDKKAV